MRISDWSTDVCSSDLSRRKDMEETARALTMKIVHTAEHDFLTGLPNRILFNDRLSLATALAARRSGKVAVLFLDLDGFKHINKSEVRRVAKGRGSKGWYLVSTHQ